MPERSAAHKRAPESSALGLERIVFFSDAVMAIAITLMVIDLKLPSIPAAAAAAELPKRLAELTPQIISFVISFAVISVYWTSHHRYFGYIRRYDGRLIFLNLVFLFFIVLMPFAASMLGEYSYLPVGTATYGLAVAGTGLSIAGLWFYASHGHRLIDAHVDARTIRARNALALLIPVMFLVSVPFAFISPAIPPVIWWTAPIAAVLLARRWETLSRR
jgi:uncharacterized membrane protein